LILILIIHKMLIAKKVKLSFIYFIIDKKIKSDLIQIKYRHLKVFNFLKFGIS